MMQKKYKDVAKNTALFALNSFVPKIIGFVLIPLYTSFLSTADYGVSDLLNSTVSLLFPVFTLGIRDAVLRFSLDKKYNQKDCLNISLRIVTIDTIILFFLTMIQLTTCILPINNGIIFFFDVLMIGNSLYDIFTAYCKGTDKVQTITISSIINSLLSMILSIVFIVYLHMGLTGLLLANTFGICVADFIFVFFGKIYKDVSNNFSKQQLHSMLIYSIPMIFSTIAWWINSASDRYIISTIAGVAASGMYAVAAKIPTIISTAQNIFSQAWSISAIKDFDKNDSDGFIGNMYSLLSTVLLIVCSCVIFFNIPLATILFKNDFFAAWQYVPMLSISVVVDGLALFIGGIFYAVKDTKARAMATIIGAVTNTIFNFTLIPNFGAYGAAVATLIGFFAGYVYSRVKIKKYITIKTNLLLIDISILLLIFQGVLAYFGNQFLLCQSAILFAIVLINRKNILKIVSVAIRTINLAISHKKS